MSWADSLTVDAVREGLMAQRKLDGDDSVIGPESREVLQALVSAGKEAEGILRHQGKLDWLALAYKRAKVEFHG